MDSIRQAPTPPLPSESSGLLLGFLGVTGFSITLPATILALDSFDPYFIALGRAALAGFCAVLILVVTRSPIPRGRMWRDIAVASSGVVFGFPLLTSWAMQHVPANHGGVVLGLLPLATALAGVIINAERPSLRFWLFGLLGSATVIAFSLFQGAGGIHIADLALLAAVAFAALGYAQGARLSQSMKAWQTICWALVIALPVTLPAGFLLFPYETPIPTLPAFGGFLYVALISQFASFFAWYKGLAMGGVARVGQMLLLQPFLTFAAAYLLLGEQIDLMTVGFACLVVFFVAQGQKAPIRRTT
ncbi:DMT family transporter [Fodinicurvata sediminis]|uniref:DMT family transporter n=1 Tax=Fodinicurvata sediminis TaxID=1121832 RepID=UPI0003B50463|nr:DMT family transporter [Fodinicurvata sediminis]